MFTIIQRKNKENQFTLYQNDMAMNKPENQNASEAAKGAKAAARNRLGTENTGTLLRQFAIPSIVAMLVGALYNIVDQFFIGQRVGELGNAATNIAFPLTIICVALALLFGIGGASAFNLHLGKGERDKAVYFLGNAISLMAICGICLCLITTIFLEPMLLFFGCPLSVLPYAKTYTGIVAFGYPFMILTTGGGHLIRADGRPRITMLCNLSGAIVNVFLDAWFVFGMNWGMAGAAAATIIGQILSGIMAMWFLAHCQTVRIERKHLRPATAYTSKIVSLGAAPCFNQLAMMVIQIVMNKSLKYYGAMSVYGEAIPIACAGIISKVNMLYFSFIIGLSQGLQPIVSFNYGAKQYKRVKRAYLQALGTGACLAIIAFLMFQLAPRQIMSIFGNASEEYFQFAVNYFRIFLFFTFANFIQPISSNFLTAIGKPKVGIFLSLTRQFFFLLPFLLIFPLFAGIDGIIYAGPSADLIAICITILLITRELRRPEYKM